MATYNKANIFVEDLANGVHNLSSNTLKLGLTNTSPNAADTDVNTSLSPDRIISTSNADEIASGNGYTEGGEALTITTNSQSGGTYTLAANQIVWTATGGTIGAFRYVYLYNSSAGAAGTRPFISWWDYGSSITLNAGETFTVKFNNSSPGTIFTIA
jgi:hypothetical protein